MPARVLLISPYRFQNAALSRLLSTELDLACELYSQQELQRNVSAEQDQPSGEVLVMLDYVGLDPETLSSPVWTDREAGPDDRIIVACFNVPRGLGVENHMLELGIRGIFYEDDGFELFKKGVLSLLEGDIWFPRRILFEHIRERSTKAPQPLSSNSGNYSLTSREEEILLMIAAGKTNAEIAEALFISSSTVKTHVYNIFQKIGVPNRIQAALWTVKHLRNPESS